MHQGLQTVVESRPPEGVVGHQLFLIGKRQSQLERLPSHFHRNERESTLSMHQGLQTIVGFHGLIRDDGCGRVHTG